MFCRINMGNSAPLACSLWGRDRRFWCSNYKQHKWSMTFYQLCSRINKWLWWGNTRGTCFQLPHFHRFEHAHHSTETRGHVEAKHFFLYVFFRHVYMDIHCPGISKIVPSYNRALYCLYYNNLSCHQSCCCLSNRTEVRCTAYKFLAKRHQNTCNTKYVSQINTHKKWATDLKRLARKTVSDDGITKGQFSYWLFRDIFD